MTVVLLAAAGAVGAAARFILDAAVTDRAGAVFPLGTLVVNVLGSLLAGVLAGLAPPSGVRAVLGVGLLGGFTTFSTFAYETLLLVRDGVPRMAVLNIAANLTLCVAAAALGFAVGV